MSLEIDRVELHFAQGTIHAMQALKPISFVVEPGTVVGLVGHTGSGKSTLLQIMAGLLEPTAGEVRLDGMELYRPETDRKKLRRAVGVSFQYPEHQLFEETVYKELAFGLIRQGVAEDEIALRIDHILPLVELDRGILQRSPFELSGGQMRRLALATTLVLRPKYLFLDEPVAGLDPRGRDGILEAIAAYRQSHDSAIVFVSHSMDDVSRIADRLIVLHAGEMVMNTTPANAFVHPDVLHSAGLDLPELYKLVLALKQAGVELPQPEAVLRTEDVYDMLKAYMKERL